MVVMDSPTGRYGDGYESDSYEEVALPVRKRSSTSTPRSVHYLALAVLLFVVVGFYGSWSRIHLEGDGEVEAVKVRENDVLVLYAYFETEAARINAEFFVKHGLHSAADFLFILNGETNFEELLPKNNSNISYLKKGNDCYDMGSYGQILGLNDQALIKKYSKFILINASVRGPFLPSWSRECWSDAYARMVTDEVKLVGMTYNCGPTPHIQSMILASDRIGVKLLVDGLLKTCPPTFQDAMLMERLATPLITDAGYKVDVMMTAWKGAANEYTPDNCTHGDPLWNNLHFGINVGLTETMFMKTSSIRAVDPKTLEVVTGWSNYAGYSSWDNCHAK